MISFIMALIALILGYCIYGRIVERVAGPTDNPTPAISHADGIDYIALYYVNEEGKQVQILDAELA